MRKMNNKCNGDKNGKDCNGYKKCKRKYESKKNILSSWEMCFVCLCLVVVVDDDDDALFS